MGIENDDDDDDLDEIIRAAVEEDEPEVTDAQIDAILADKTFARIVTKAVQPYEQIMTEEGLHRARRTLAVLFLTDPHAVSLLARAREAGPPDATALKGPLASKQRRRSSR